MASGFHNILAVAAALVMCIASCTKETTPLKIEHHSKVVEVTPKQALIECAVDLPENMDTNRIEYGILLSDTTEMTEESSFEIPAPSSRHHSVFEVKLVHLECGTTYYYCIYSKYDGQYILGESSSFRTEDLPQGAVDLHLSNDVLWAECNLGAESPEGLGDGYAFGELAPKDHYLANNYRFFNDYNSRGRMSISKYTFDDGQTDGSWYDANGNFVGDGKIILDPEDDAATQQLGDGWRTPRPEDFYVLHDECQIYFDTMAGVNGASAYTEHGHIFLPFPYQCVDDQKIILEGMGIYRTSQLWAGKKPVVMVPASDECMVYWFLRTNLDINTIDAVMAQKSFRELGLAIRPVYDCNIR